MVTLRTLRALAELQREMASEGREAAEAALREAIGALGGGSEGYLTTGQAAERLGVTIPTVKRWVERGTLAGGPLSGRWVVAAESVERVLRLRAALLELDREGNPAAEEVEALYRRPRAARRHAGVSAAPA